jgi:3-hydroxyacyl-CoA dehydrogenase
MAAINPVVDLATVDRIAILTVDHPPVNALSADVRAGLDEGVRRAGADNGVDAIVLCCAGRTFIAGADITEFGKPPREPSLQALLETIEGSSKPVVAAIFGTALGGGLETALASHWRVASADAKLGLPEVKLGLLPGAGGTQRLPRLVGVEAALEMITSGAPVGAKAALTAGLIDEIIAGDLTAGAVAYAGRVVAEGRPLRKISAMDDAIAAAREKPEIFAEFRKANARKFRGFEAPEACIQAIEAAVNLPFAEGLRRERDLFTKLVGGDQSRAQRHVFFAERQVARIPDIGPDTEILPVKKAGVVGAGTMGGGIAMNFLNAGLPVTIVETAQDALDRGVATIRKNYENTAKKGRMTQADVDTRMALLTPTLSLDALKDCDLVIEAVFELMEVKKDIFGKLDKIVKRGAILATNTSYLDVDEIAASTSRPDLVLGLHFFSPANVMKLLEIVRGKATSKPVVATAMKLAKTLGKVGVLVGVCHGFVGNRMLAARQREAQKLILEGAMPWDVDRVLYDFGFPMGPFAMADLAGLDLGWKREASSGSTVREILNEMGRWGQKTSAGFYDYDENRKATPSPITEKVVLDFAAKQGVTRRQVSDQEILERCLYPMVNEGAKILEEGVALRAGDIDIVWINGYGWPVYRGGPMFWADLIGLKTVAAKMQEFQARLGADFEVSPLLLRLADAGKTFGEGQS